MCPSRKPFDFNGRLVFGYRTVSPPPPPPPVPLPFSFHRSPISLPLVLVVSGHFRNNRVISFFNYPPGACSFRDGTGLTPAADSPESLGDRGNHLLMTVDTRSISRGRVNCREPPIVGSHVRLNNGGDGNTTPLTQSLSLQA